MALSQVELNKRSMAKTGKRNKVFSLDAETLALFEQLAEKTGKAHVELLREAMRKLAEQYR